MRRFAAVAVMLVMLASNSEAVEPPPPHGPLVLAHGECQRWLLCLGKNVVRIEPLALDPEHAEAWLICEQRARRIEASSPLLICSSRSDLLSTFWVERIANQRPVERVKLSARSCLPEQERERLLLQQAHRVLVNLCPEARPLLDRRLQRELDSLKSLGAQPELASR